MASHGIYIYIYVYYDIMNICIYIYHRSYTNNLGITMAFRNAAMAPHASERRHRGFTPSTVSGGAIAKVMVIA